MKTYLFCVILLVSGIFQCFGQHQNQVSSFNPLDIPVSNQDDIWSVDFAPAIWLNSANAPSSHKFSFSTGLTYHYEFNFTMDKRFALALGVGYYYTTLSHRGVFLNDSTPHTTWSPVNSTDELDYSRLNLHRINFPLEFRIKLESKLKIYIGYQSSFIIGAKNRSKINGNETAFDNFNNLMRFQHGPRLRIGYKDVFLFSNFYLSSLFRNRTQLPMQMVEFGISIGG